jgi:hypothetical protein
MSNDTPTQPDADPRERPTEPAEGGTPGDTDDGPDIREHATEPAEGKEIDDV